MTEANEHLLSIAREYVTEIYSHHIKPEFVFHNLEHTEEVVEACSYMADYHHLNEEDRLVLMLAAWFHDTGYLKNTALGHEDESIKQATQFLSHHNVDEIVVQRVASCIAATRMPQSPVSLVEKILCDADMHHLATDDFKARNELLKQEQQTLLNQKIAKKEWRKNNISFLENHKYFTEYGQEQLEPGKQKNLNDLKKKKKKKGKKKVEESEVFPYMPSSSLGNWSDEEKAAKKETERGIQTMFRTTSNNHFELSSLADSKSNIMISVNSIIISVTLTIMVARLSHYPKYTIPTVILVLVCLSSIIFAILATRPSVSGGRFTEEDIRNKRANLLFFGNFFQMPLEEYQWGMNEMLKDREYLYNSMIKDIYSLGVVLARKYKFLRIAYTIFMWGLIIAVIAFAIAAFSTNTGTNNPTDVIDY